MNTTTALFKKELHTAKWFLLGGVLFFWSFPLMEGTGAYLRSGTFRTNMPSDMSWMFGGLFAIITAAGLVCLDMPKGMYEFWRSRPVRLLPYMIIKYCVGLAVTLFVITLPLLFELYLHRNAGDSYSFGRSILCCHTFIILLLYSIAFCAGHLFRNMTEAAIISFAAALLIYFVPVLVPAMEPLSFLNIVTNSPAPTIEIITKGGEVHQSEVSGVHPSAVSRVVMKGYWGYSLCGDRYMYWMRISAKSLLVIYLFKGFLLFTGTMTALSIVLIIAAGVCLKHHIHIRLGLKSLCWSLGLVALILFSAAGFSVGSNLKCLAIIPQPAPKEISPDGLRAFVGRGNVAFFYHADQESKEVWLCRTKEEPGYSYRQDTYHLEGLFPAGAKIINPEIVRYEQKPETVFVWNTIDESGQEKAPTYVCYFHIITLEDATRTARIASRLPLAEMKTKIPSPVISSGLLDSQNLFVQIGREIIIIDISDYANPRVLNRIAYQNAASDEDGLLRFNMPSDNSLSPEQQRYMSRYVCRYNLPYSWDGDMYAEAIRGAVRVYKIDNINGNKIRMKKIAEQKSLPLERLMYSDPWMAVLKNNILYVLQHDFSLTVYHVDEAAGTLKRTGHYAAPEAGLSDIQIRQDGNIALMGGQIHIIQPPEVKKN